MTAQQLKNSILQLAVQGKLVPQNPNDEPVKVAPYKGETPFIVPNNWVWAKLGDAFNMQAGKFVKACDIYEDNNPKRYPCYGGNGLRGYVDTFNTEGNFPLIGRQGALCGNINMATGKFYATEHAVVAKPNNDIDVDWAYYALISLNLNQYSTATAQPGLAVSKISNVPISIPPLVEQHRIVERIEQLLPHIADYDAAEQKLTALNANFPSRLKKSILQSAVQGKLVPQDPNDEPASVLLERIRAEKEQLIKDGKLKKQKPLPPIVDDEIPFDVPEGWVWVRLGDIFSLQAGKFMDAQNIHQHSTDDRFPCYGGNGLRGYVDMYNRDGTFPLIGRQGALCGNINLACGRFYATEHAVVVQYFANVDINWICHFLKAQNLNQYSTATAQPGLAVGNINNVLIPLPPLNEQRRISAQIENIFPNVKEMEAI